MLCHIQQVKNLPSQRHCFSSSAAPVQETTVQHPSACRGMAGAGLRPSSLPFPPLPGWQEGSTGAWPAPGSFLSVFSPRCPRLVTQAQAVPEVLAVARCGCAGMGTESCDKRCRAGRFLSL